MDFLFLGNALWIDLLNTEIICQGERVDLLMRDEDVTRWAREAALSGRCGVVEMRSLRTLLRAIADQVTAGQPVGSKLLERLNGWLSQHPGPYRLEGKALPYTLAWAGDLSGRVARDAAQTLSGESWQRLRRCENPQCILYFLDTSRNGTRRWCSMAMCGNREKARQHYQRSRTNSD